MSSNLKENTTIHKLGSPTGKISTEPTANLGLWLHFFSFLKEEKKLVEHKPSMLFL